MVDTVHTLPYETIALDGLFYPARTVGYRNLARFENRVLTGSPGFDDDELLSGRGWQDFSGGCGIFDETEGADTGTYWDAEGVDIDHPKQVTLMTLPTEWQNTGTAYLLGEVGSNVHVAWGLNIYEHDAGTDAMVDTTYNLAAAPTNKGVWFDSRLFIPQGSSGYECMTTGGLEAAAVTNGAGITATAFAIWDGKLAAIEHNRQLSIYDPITNTWDSPSTAILDAGQTVRDIITYFNRSDEPSLYVMTTDCLWAYDAVSEIFIRTNMVMPRHPDNGKGMAVWRTGETLHIAASMGVYAWTGPGGTASALGLDRKQGVPWEYQGRIVDLTASHNHLYALVESLNTGGFHSLYRFNGIGWTRVWSHSNNSDSIKWCMVTGVDNTQRLWWDVGDTIFNIELPRPYTNPRELLNANSGNYVSSGYVITSWFDANMPAFDKLYAYALANIPVCNFDDDTTLLTIEYQSEKTDVVWTPLLSVSTAGARYAAMNFSSQQIRLRIIWYTSDPTKSPLFESAVVKYVKVPSAPRTWQITIDLNFEGVWIGDGVGGARDANTMAQELEALLRKRTMITLTHAGNTYTTRVSNIQGWDNTGEDRRKSRTLTLVEIPMPESIATESLP